MRSINIPPIGEDNTKSGSLSQVYYRPRLFWIIVPSFIYFLALFVTVPIAVQVLVAVVCDTLGEDDCNCSRVSSEASLINLYFSLAANIPAFLLSGFYGSLADVYGRKFCIIVSMSGYLIYAVALLFIEVYRPVYYKAIFIACAFVLGATGSFAVFQMAVFSYAADITHSAREKRGVIYSLLESCLFFAKIVGPLSAGLWAQAYGFKAPLIVAVLLCCTGILWAAAMPESLAPDADSRSRPLELDPFKTLRNLYLITAEGGLSSPIPYLSLAFFLYFAAYMGNQQIQLLYVKHQFHWDPATIGYYDFAEGLVQMLSMVAVPWLITRMLGNYVEKWWLLVGYAFRAAHFLLFGLARSTEAVFGLTLMLIFCGPLTPRTRSIISNAASAKMQASVLSAFSALQSLSQFAAPGFSAGYSVTVYYCPGCMYVALACLCFGSAAIVIYVIAFDLLKVAEKRPGGLITHSDLQRRGGLSPIGEEDEEDEDEDEGGGKEQGGEKADVAFAVAGVGLDGFDHPVQPRSGSRSHSQELGEGSLTRRLLAER